MTVKRTQIRAALASLLSGLPTTGVRVFDLPPHALAAAKLPALLIRCGEQRPGERAIDSGRAMWCEMDIDIDLMVKDAGDWQAVLDMMLGEVTGALFQEGGQRTLGGLLNQPMEEGLVGDPDFDLSTDKPVARMTYRQRVVFTA